MNRDCSVAVDADGGAAAVGGRLQLTVDSPTADQRGSWGSQSVRASHRAQNVADVQAGGQCDKVVEEVVVCQASPPACSQAWGAAGGHVAGTGNQSTGGIVNCTRTAML